MNTQIKHTRTILVLVVLSLVTAPAPAADAAFKRIFSGDGLGRQLQEFQGKVVFTRWAGGNNEIYLSDGTELGTKRIHATSKVITHVCPGQRTIFFVLEDSANSQTPYELWRTDGTPGKAERVTELWPPDKFNLTSFVTRPGLLMTVLDNDRLVLAGWDDKTQANPRIWTSDGTAAGTKPVAFPKRGTRSLSQLTRVGQHVFFDIPEDGIYRTDGTSTQRVLDCKMVKSGLWSSVGNLVCLAYLGSQKPDAEITMISEDGTTTSLAAEKDQGPFQPQDFFEVGSSVFFVAQQGFDNYKLWSVSVSGGSPRVVKDFNMKRGGWMNIIGTTASRAYFMVRNPGLELWSSDGTETGTVRLASLHEPPNFFVSSGEKVFFDLRPEGTYFESVAVSAGTAGATQVLPGSPTSGKPMSGIVIGSALFFTTDQKEIYRYDLGK